MDAPLDRTAVAEAEVGSRARAVTYDMPVSPRDEGAADADRGLAPADPNMQSSGKRRSALTSAFEELALHTNERSPEVRDRPRAPPRAPPLPLRSIFPRLGARPCVSLSACPPTGYPRASRAPPPFAPIAPDPVAPPPLPSPLSHALRARVLAPTSTWASPPSTSKPPRAFAAPRSAGLRSTKKTTSSGAPGDNTGVST